QRQRPAPRPRFTQPEARLDTARVPRADPRATALGLSRTEPPRDRRRVPLRLLRRAGHQRSRDGPRMSRRARDWAWAQETLSRPRKPDERLSSGAKLVLLYLAERAADDGSCFPGIDSIAEATGQGPSTVRRHLASLVEGKLIERERRHRSN